MENGLENASVPVDGLARGQGLPMPIRPPNMVPSTSFQPPAPQFNYFPAPVPFNASSSAQANVVGSSNIAPGAHPGCCGNCGASRPAVAPVNPPKYIPVPPVNNNPNVPPVPSNYHFGVSNGPMQPSAVGISYPNQGMMASACPVIRNYGNEARGHSAEWVDPMRFPPIQRSAPNAPAALNSMFPAYAGFDGNQSGPFGRYPPLHPGNGANGVPQFPPRVGQDFSKPPPSNVSYGPHSMVPPMPFNAPFQGSVPPAPSRGPFVPLPGAPPPPKSSDDDLAAQLGFLSINPTNDTAKSTGISSRYLQETYDELVNLASQISPETKPFDTSATVVTHAARKFNFARPAEWRLSIRTHSCTTLNQFLFLTI